MSQFNNTNIIELTSKNLKKIGNNIVITHNSFKNKNGLLFVHANWCGFCQITKPEIISLSKITGSEFPIGALEDIHKDAIRLLDIKGYPTIFIVENGIISKEYNDSRQTKDIRNAICKIDEYNFCTK